VPTAFLGRLSNDAFGRRLTEILTADHVDLSLAYFGTEPTTTAVADVNGRGLVEYSFLVDGTSAPNLTPAMLPARLPNQVRALHVGTLGLVLEPMASTLVELVEREAEGRLVMLDPNVRPAVLADPAGFRSRLESVIARSTIVKASDADLAWLYPDLGYAAAADALLGSGVRLVVVTLGAQGAFGATGGIRVHASAPAVEVEDTIGAGDAFGAALLAWLHDHDRLSPDLRLGEEELRDALGYACLVASITCERAGADPPLRAEVV
jgi:fructokinase